MLTVITKESSRNSVSGVQLVMDRSSEYRPEGKASVMAAALFLCTAGSMACLFLVLPSDFIVATGLVRLSAIAGSVVLACASAIVFFRPPWGYRLGLIAGLATLPWFAPSELSPWRNSWITLNLADAGQTSIAGLTILSVGLIVSAIACSFLRLLPARLLLKKTPLCGRTWPACASGLLVLAVWFGKSAVPYRLPYIADGPGASFRILHVEKRGLRFHEVGISGSRDGRFFVWQQDRRLFRYHFEGRSSHGVMPQTTYDHVSTFAEAPELRKLHTGPARGLSQWNADGWYVVLKDSHLLAFSSEYRTMPPALVTDLFHEIVALPTTLDGAGVSRDVSLGLGYDPVAALGFIYLNQPCFARANCNSQR